MGKGNRVAALLTALAAIAAAGAGAPIAGATPAAGGTAPLAALPSATSYSAAVPLSDGRVFVGPGQSFASAEIYAPDTNTWTTVSPPPDAIQGAAVAPLPHDRVLLAGVDDSVSQEVSEIYDADAGTWSTAAPLPSARAAMVAAALPNGDVIAAGGYLENGSTEPQTSYIYDPTTDTWSTGPATPGYGGDAAVSMSDGRVMVVGSDSSATSYQQGSEIYDPATGAWTAGPLLGAGYLNAASAAALPNDRVALVLDAADQGDPTEAVYDPDNGEFDHGTQLPVQPVGAAVAPLPDGSVLIAGGQQPSSDGDGSTTWNTVQTAQAWTPAAAPIQTVLSPWVAGAPEVGQTLTSGSLPTPAYARTFQWQRCSSGACVNVGAPATETGSAAGGANYTVTQADVGARLQVTVTSSDPGLPGTATALTSGAVPQPITAISSSTTTALAKGNGLGEIDFERNDTAIDETVPYRITFNSPGSAPLYPALTGKLTFPAAYAQEFIKFPVLDHGVRLLAGTVTVTLGSPSVGAISGGSSETFPIYPDNDLSSYVRAPGNPLQTRGGANPLAGANLFVDHASIAARVAYLWRNTNPTGSALLQQIAQEPGTARFGAWDGLYPGRSVATYLSRVQRQEPGTVPMISTYRIIHGECRSGGDTPADAKAYDAWIRSFAEGIGTHPAVLFLEMDSLITTPCLDHAALKIRLGELADAVNVLSDVPHLVVYLDAGAADALRASRAAALLRGAGVAHTEGFFLNATHFDWTRKEIAYGEKISRMIGGKHFVVNTAENGQGPLIPRDRAVNGNEVLCNPPGRGLGPKPTVSTGFDRVDAFAWIANPGVSGGPCVPGAPKTGRFWPAEAISLVQHADYAVR